MTRPILIVGGSGQIGERVARLYAEQGGPVVSTCFSQARAGASPLDASDANQVMRLTARLQPRLIINCVNAKGGTDACERDPSLAQRFHFGSACHLVDAARAVGAKFVHLSTDYVFDGRAGPYSEDDVPCPISQLGRAKRQAEQYVLEQLPAALILRTSFVFSWAQQTTALNFVMQLFAGDRQGSVVRVPTDQIGNVTYAPNLAEAVVELVELNAKGLYHVAGTTRCSKYAWALRVAHYFGLRAIVIQGVTTAELQQAAPRPLQSGFRLEKVQAILKRTRLWSLEEGLAEMEREMAGVTQQVGVDG